MTAAMTATKAEEDAVLTELIASFVSTPSSKLDVDGFLSRVGLAPLFARLVAAGGYEASPAAIAIDRVMKRKALELLADDQVRQLVRSGLAHSVADVRVFTVRQLGHLLAHADGVRLLLGHDSGARRGSSDEEKKMDTSDDDDSDTLYDLVVALLGDENVAVAQAAADLVVALAQSEAGMAQFFAPQTVATLHRLAVDGDDIDSSVQLRVLSLCARIACVSKDAFERLRKSTRLLPVMIGKRGNDGAAADIDILLYLNLLQVMVELASCEWGLRYVLDERVLTQCMQLSETVPFLLSGTLKLLAKLALLPHVLVLAQSLYKDDTVLRFLLGVLHKDEDGDTHDDVQVVAAAVEAVANVATSPDGLQYLTQRQAVLLKKLVTFATHHEEAVKLQALHGLASVFASATKAQMREQAEALLNALSAQQWATLQRDLELPFMEMRYAVLRMVSELVRLPFGVRWVARKPGFVEYLLDRGTESTKLGAQWKYTVLQNLSLNPLSRDASVLSNQQLQQVTLYVQRGPFYAKARGTRDRHEEPLVANPLTL
eukprot:TRINITY_DN67179_c2_g1_i1.p1 TRINITY_DN67179_c2_g1~~TRINITY_DN67179_c2_g1_i1.p1  ORF type:complete len:553 (-),score=269.72 TRINITY_DN67179_c2_g1_i1:116-1747(-)